MTSERRLLLAEGLLLRLARRAAGCCALPPPPCRLIFRIRKSDLISSICQTQGPRLTPPGAAMRGLSLFFRSQLLVSLRAFASPGDRRLQQLPQLAARPAQGPPPQRWAGARRGGRCYVAAAGGQQTADADLSPNAVRRRAEDLATRLGDAVKVRRAKVLCVCWICCLLEPRKHL